MDREELNFIAFVDFLHFAATQPGTLKAYNFDTGDNYAPPTNALDRAFEKATGRDKEFARNFIEWCAEQYGRDLLPADFIDRIFEKTA